MIDWVPFSEKAKDFLFHSVKRYNIAYGSVRSSKTVTMTVRWLKYLVDGPPGDLLMMGYSMATLQRNVLNDLFDIVGKNAYRWVNRQQGELILYGRRIYCLGAATEKADARIRGATFAGAYCDEANLFPQIVWNQIQARLSVKGALCFANCNPESPSHWFYKDVIANKDIPDDLKAIWHFTMDDNLSLSEEYKKTLYASYSGVFRKRLILGEWCAAEGAIYEDFAENPDNFLYKPKENDRFKSINIGIDYGASVSRCAFVCTALTIDNRLIALDEKSLEGVKTPNYIYEQLWLFYLQVRQAYGEVSNIFADYGALGQVITAGLVNYLQVKGAQARVSDCLKGNIINRILLTLRLMGTGRFFISTRCKKLKEAFLMAVWDEKHDDTRLDNGTSDIDSLDAFEYSFYSFSKVLNREA